MSLKILSYVRYPLALFASVAATVITAFVVLAVSFASGPDSLNAQTVIRLWSHLVLKLFNIKTEVQGLENLPAGGAILLFNHASDFDIPVIMAVLPKLARFGAKVELFNIPFVAMAMRATGTLPIARGDRERVLEVYRQSVSRLRLGVSFLLAPEGTRQTQAEIGAFKSGPFRFAIDAKVAICPIVIEGVLEILPKKSVLIMWGQWTRTVRVRILPPVATEPYTLSDVGELQSQVRGQMIACYQSLRELRSRQ